MSTKYKTTTTEEAYFITITTVGWVDVLTPAGANVPLVNTKYKKKSIKKFS
jgi:hypothetical protein